MPNMPNTAPKADSRTISSNVIGMVDGHAYGCLPDTQNG